MAHSAFIYVYIRFNHFDLYASLVHNIRRSVVHFLTCISNIDETPLAIIYVTN